MAEDVAQTWDGRRRRRKEQGAPVSLRRSIYNGVAISLLMAPAAIGIFLFGAVRMWSVGPLMTLAYLGIAMYFLQSFFGEEPGCLRIPPGWGLWALFWLYGLLTISRAEVPYEARIEMLEVGSYLGAYLAWTEMSRHRGRWRILLGLAIFLVTLIAWYALIQHVHGTRMVLNLERPAVYGMRASGTFFCPNHFAALMEAIVPVALALVLMPSAGFPLRLFAGYGLAILLPVMFLTQSRSGWLGTVAGLGVCATLIALRRSRRLFAIILVAFPLLVAAAAGALWQFSPMVRARVAGAMLSSPDPAVQGRLLIWKDAIPMIRDKPVLGHGPGSFIWAYPRFKTNRIQLFFNSMHSEALQVLAEYGAIGLALFLAFLGWAIIRYLYLLVISARDQDAGLIAGFLGALAAAAVHSFFDFNLHIFSVNHMLALVGGVTASGLFASGALRPRLLRIPWQWVVPGAGALAALLLALASAQALASYGLHFLGDRDRQLYRMDSAARLYEWARRVDPGNWRPWLGAAHIYQSRSFWDLDESAKTNLARRALSYYERARERNPYDMEVVYSMSKVYQQLGDLDQALALRRQAAETERYHLFYTTRLGLLLRQMDRPEEALAVFDQARSFGVSNDMVTLNIRLLRDAIAEKSPPPAAP